MMSQEQFEDYQKEVIEKLNKLESVMTNFSPVPEVYALWDGPDYTILVVWPGNTLRFETLAELADWIDSVYARYGIH